LLQQRTARLREGRAPMCAEVAAAARLGAAAVGADAVSAAACGEDAAADLALSVRCEMAIRIAHTLVRPPQAPLLSLWAVARRRQPPSCPGRGPRFSPPTPAPPPPPQVACAVINEFSVCLLYAAAWPWPVNDLGMSESIRLAVTFEPECLPLWDRHPSREAAEADDAAAAATSGGGSAATSLQHAFAA
jgi:hypothetical protein